MQPGASSEPRSYTDFEPRSQWMQAEEGDTLIVDVSGMLSHLSYSFNLVRIQILIAVLFQDSERNR